jgi:RNA polymerase sigma factor FliA
MHMHTVDSLLPVPSVSEPTLGVSHACSLADSTVETAFPDSHAPGATAEVRQRLVLDNMATVRMVARSLQRRMPQHIDVEDLVSAGTLGLLDAAAKFDGTKDVQFKSYAQFRIRGAMLDSLREMDWSPRDLRRKSRAMAEAIRTLSARLGRTPTDAETAQEMGLSLHSFQELTGELKGLNVGSLHAERGDEGEEQELDFLEAPASESPLAICMKGEEKRHLAAAIADLPEKERLVLTLYYYEGLTMKEVGFVLGVVESRVSQLRSAALGRLRKRLARTPTAPGQAK